MGLTESKQYDEKTELQKVRDEENRKEKDLNEKNEKELQTFHKIYSDYLEIWSCERDEKREISIFDRFKEIDLNKSFKFKFYLAHMFTELYYKGDSVLIDKNYYHLAYTFTDRALKYLNNIQLGKLNYDEAYQRLETIKRINK